MISLTVSRQSPTDKILIPVLVFNPQTEGGAEFVGQLDTGNDHTCVRREVLQALGVGERSGALVVQGVNGSESAGIAVVTLGIRFDDDHPVTICNHEVGVVANLTDCDLLLGRDLLGMFGVDIRRDGTVTLSR